MSIGDDEMKCDVCFTNIPMGKDRCPNCGYKIRKKYVSSYDASGKTHNHIQTKSKYMNSRVQHSLKQPSREKLLFIVRTIMVIIGISIIIGCASAIFLSLNHIGENENVEVVDMNPDLENLSFEDIVGNGYDYDGTVEITMEYKDDLLAYLHEMNYSNIGVSEQAYDGSFGLETILYVDFYNHHYHFEVAIHHQQAELTKAELNISGKFETGRNQLILKEDDVRAIADYIGIDSAYSLLCDFHKKMTKSNDAYEYRSYTDELDVYMSEKYYNMKDPYYWFYYSLTKDFDV